MAVVSQREVIPRTFSHKFGESPTAERKFVVTVDVPTPTQDIIASLGVYHGAPHPEYSYLLMLDGQVVETDRHHVEATFKYEVPKQEDLDPNPLARPDVWSFSTGGSQVPALIYYEGAGNGNRKPLQNSANDYFEGLTVNEAEVRASIAGNRLAFPLATAAAVTNSVNDASYLGGAKHSWFCAGISGQQATEVVNGVEIRYWQITVELIYRASGHNLLLPNIGWNYCKTYGIPPTVKEKLRCRVKYVPEDGGDAIWVPTAGPWALNSDGSMKKDGEAPDILERRIYPETNFSSYFGTPPF